MVCSLLLSTDYTQCNISSITEGGAAKTQTLSSTELLFSDFLDNIDALEATSQAPPGVSGTCTTTATTRSSQSWQKLRQVAPPTVLLTLLSEQNRIKVYKCIYFALNQCYWLWHHEKHLWYYNIRFVTQVKALTQDFLIEHFLCCDLAVVPRAWCTYLMQIFVQILYFPSCQGSQISRGIVSMTDRLLGELSVLKINLNL